MKRISLLATLAVAGLLTACGDDNETNPTPKTNAELLMAKSWTLTAWTQKEGSAPEENIYAQVDACSKDDKLKFQASNVLVYDEGANVCAGEAQSISGIWALTDNNKTLTLGASNQSTANIVTLSGTIEELTATKLVVTETYDSNGVKSIIRYTFSGN